MNSSSQIPLATITGQRWCVRIMSLIYYFSLAPLLYELFAYGARLRSAFLLAYVLLSLSGLQIGFKESDRWVRAWYWSNLFFIVAIAYLSFFESDFSKMFNQYSWERWVHLGLLFISIAFFPLHFFLKKRVMQSSDDSDWNANLKEYQTSKEPLSSRPSYVIVNPEKKSQQNQPPPVASQPHEDGGFLGH